MLFHAATASSCVGSSSAAACLGSATGVATASARASATVRTRGRQAGDTRSPVTCITPSARQWRDVGISVRHAGGGRCAGRRQPMAEVFVQCEARMTTRLCAVHKGMTLHSFTHVALRVEHLRQAEALYRELFALDVAFREAE